MMTKKAKTKNNRGFTLIEVLIAFVLFVSVAIATVSVFVDTVRNQTRAAMEQDLQDNIRFILERFSKEVRMATIESGSNQNKLRITNQESEFLEYEFQSSSFKRAGQALNGSQIEIDGRFFIKNAAGEQPRVTIVLKAKPASASVPVLQTQNTVTLRSY